MKLTNIIIAVFSAQSVFVIFLLLAFEPEGPGILEEDVVAVVDVLTEDELLGEG